jgi:predicted ABC-type ATPase
VTVEEEEVLRFFRDSSFLASAGFGEATQQLGFANGRLDFANKQVNSYLASVATDFIRQKLLEQNISFTFETVMSHPSKVEFLKQAQQAGYRTYLYFVATDDPAINISRVQNRVKQGGHGVPEDKITSCYQRSLDLLMDAICHTNRAYIFDNSGEMQNHIWLAEITEGRELELKTEQAPAWFKRSVLDKIDPLSASRVAYDRLRKCLQDKGIGSYFQSFYQLVISDEYTAMPTSNSFWVTRKNNDWYLGTWLPTIYLVPKEQNLCLICERVLRSARTAIYTVDAQLAEEMGLRRLTEGEMVQTGFDS